MHEEVEKIYAYYLYNLHVMVNKLGYTYEFNDIWHYIISNFGSIADDDFSTLPNPYLLEYKDSQLNLAADILENGMYFPFYGGRINNQINEYLYFITQGKHRLHTLRRYFDQVGIFRRSFLYIFYPIDIQYFMSRLDPDVMPAPVEMYRFDYTSKKIIRETTLTYTENLRIMDRFGGDFGKYIFDLRKTYGAIKAPTILTNKQAFNSFINKPFELALSSELLEEQGR